MEGQKVKSGEEGDMIVIENILREKASFAPSDIQQFRNAYTDPKLNRVLGCIFGAMIGDALGAYCEFKKVIPQHISDKVMDMPGGGTFGTILPGQYTDDTELAYHLLKGLLSFDQNKDLEGQKLKILCNIGKEYVRWVENGPFDIGNTCRSAIEVLELYRGSLQSDFKEILQEIEKRNRESQSNGSLMRIAPMAAFFSLLGIDPLKEIRFIKDEIRLTHPNRKLQAAGASWVYLLSKLINRREEENLEEFESIMKEVESQEEFSLIWSYFQEGKKLKSASMSAAQQMGWAKIAHSYAYKFLVYVVGKDLLKQGDVFKSWIKWVICRAGDTDTNASISGGLIGAVIGFQRLPLQYLKKTFELQFALKEGEMKYTTKPREYEPANVLKLVLELIKKSQKYTNNKKQEKQAHTKEAEHENKQAQDEVQEVKHQKVQEVKHQSKQAFVQPQQVQHQELPAEVKESESKNSQQALTKNDD